MRIMQGDQYHLPIMIESENGAAVTSEMVQQVVVSVGALVKKYPGELAYDTDAGTWMFPLHQEETLKLPRRVLPVQIRVKFVGAQEEIIGISAEGVEVQELRHKEVM